MKELIKLAEKKGFDDWMGYVNPEEYVTLCLIQKWLREEHGIDVDVTREFFYNEDTHENEKMGFDVEIHKDDAHSFGDYGIKTYEQALQKGLEQGLKLI